ncbi:hypothetical protein EDC94DRAFT_644521 [Helicostylum pulchrum]|nr:hypothetical protein EDC94DRAFT_644521 [Helicostylum pulchrum]
MENRRNSMRGLRTHQRIGTVCDRTHERLQQVRELERVRREELERLRQEELERLRQEELERLRQEELRRQRARLFLKVPEILLSRMFLVFFIWIVGSLVLFIFGISSEESWGFTMYIIYNLIPVVIKFHNRLGTVAMNFYVENIAVPAIQYGIKYVKKE